MYIGLYTYIFTYPLVLIWREVYQQCLGCAAKLHTWHTCISGLVVEYIVAIDVTRVRFPADALSHATAKCDQHILRRGKYMHVRQGKDVVAI